MLQNEDLVLRQMKHLDDMQLFFYFCFFFLIINIGKHKSNLSTTVHMHSLFVCAVSNCLSWLVAINGSVCC